MKLKDSIHVGERKPISLVRTMGPDRTLSHPVVRVLMSKRQTLMSIQIQEREIKRNSLEQEQTEESFITFKVCRYGLLMVTALLGDGSQTIYLFKSPITPTYQILPGSVAPTGWKHCLTPQATIYLLKKT